MRGTTPCRVPLACGALGDYDRARVERMASLLGGGSSPVAAELGVRHELLRAPAEDYWTDWEEHHRRVEHRFVDTAEVLDTSDPKASNRALFDGLRRYGHTHEGLDERFHGAILDNARHQCEAVVKPFTGHPSQPLLPRRWCSEVAVEGHRRLVTDGPLAEHISPHLTTWLEDPRRGEISPLLRAGMEVVSFFHDWWHLYRRVLRDSDASALLR